MRVFVDRRLCRWVTDVKISTSGAMLVIISMIIAGFINFVLWSIPNRSVFVEEPPGGKFKSVSFGPFRNNQSPLALVYPTAEQIEEDIKIIRKQTDGVRTYTSLEGLENVPALARKYGLKVIMGAWLSNITTDNERDVQSVIALANAYPDVITRVIVGNETLLRGELKPQQIATYLRRVRNAIRQPVSYADVWENWLKHPYLAGEVDFVTIHLLPYWEDAYSGVNQATISILRAYRQISDRFPDKPILIGEAGWPTAGRTRGPATPSRVNKARFDSLFVRLAADHGFDYNLIEAFDQKWKIKQEGTVGGRWGLYDADRQPKFEFGTPIVENPAWWKQFLLSFSLAAVVTAGVAVFGLPLPSTGLAAVAILSQGLAAGWVLALGRALDLPYFLHDVFFAFFMLTLQTVASAGMIAATISFWTTAPPPARDAYGIILVADYPWFARIGRLAMKVLLMIAVIWSALLIFDGRYRDFPLPAYAAPAFGVLALGVFRLLSCSSGCRLCEAFAFAGLFERDIPSAPQTSAPARSWLEVAKRRPLESRLALALIAMAVGVIVREGLVNTEATLWSATQVILALPLIATVVCDRTETAENPDFSLYRQI
ncbi:Glycoside hydrolase [Azospirillaceae bacterium]